MYYMPIPLLLYPTSQLTRRTEAAGICLSATLSQ